MNLPNDLIAESTILGAAQLDVDVASDISEKAKVSDFYDAKHKSIFEAIRTISQSGGTPDQTTISTELQKTGVLSKIGGFMFLDELVENTPGVANYDIHLKRIRDLAIRRRMITKSKEVSEVMADETKSALSLADGIIGSYSGILDEDSPVDVLTSKDMLRQEISSLTDRRDRGVVQGVTSGYEKLDEMTSGFGKGELTIIAARPSIGKTALAVNIGTNAAQSEKSVLMFSHEMSGQLLMQRIISNEASVDIGRMRTGMLNSDEYNRIMNNADRLSKLRFEAVDKPSLTVPEIKSIARRHKRKKGCDLIIVDYLGLVLPDKKSFSRDREVAEMTLGFKAMARDLDIPVILLSQLNRSVEARKPQIPIMSDLRDSGCIEQDADLIMFIYREDYYKQNDPERAADWQPNNEADIIISKQRNGPTGVVKLKWTGNFSRFSKMED